jgi:ribosomal protein S8
MKKLANFISTLRSALKNKVLTTTVPNNKRILKICSILEELGYINGYSLLSRSRCIVYLKYKTNKSVIRMFSLVSKSSLRTYLKKRNVMGFAVGPYIKGNNFLVISTSTSKILLTDIECKIYGVGGEPILVIG